MPFSEGSFSGRTRVATQKGKRSTDFFFRVQREPEKESSCPFIFLDSKITADYYCSHEIERCILLGRKAMTNLNSILRNRDVTLLTKVPRVKAMVFPVVMYRSES